MSAAAMSRLQAVEQAFASIERALRTDDVDAAQAGFQQIEELVQGTDVDLFSGEGQAAWAEISMRLLNDAFEGREAATRADTLRAAQALRGTVEAMRDRLGTMPAAAEEERDGR